MRKPALRFCQTNTCTMPTQTPKHIFFLNYFFFFNCAKFNSVPYGKDSSLILSVLETENRGVKKSVGDFGKLAYLHILNFLKETSLYCPLITGPEAKFLLLCRYCICQHLLTHNSTITLTSRPLIQLFNNHIFKE